VKRRYYIGTMIFFILGAVLRLGLFWVNEPFNTFDDHYEPIFMFLQNGTIPGKYACMECYQPPVFYYSSALLAKPLIHLQFSTAQLLKFFQFLNCLYAIATLEVLYLILKKLPLSDFSRLLVFGTLCLLPRHIYMAALHSNDALSYLTVAACAYLLLLVAEGKHSLPYLCLLSMAVTTAIFTKYTCFVVIPMVLATFVMMVLPPRRLTWGGALGKALLVLLVPLVLLGASMVDNKRTYGAALPFNAALADGAKFLPYDRKGGDFLSFRPWLFIEEPIIRPGQSSSFWTLLYSSMWFDTEPKFIQIVNAADPWWRGYISWLRGLGPYPEDSRKPAEGRMVLGSILEALGLLPFFLVLCGIGSLVRKCRDGLRKGWDEVTRLQMFLVLLAFNIAGVVQLTLGMPVYSAMKASYLLNSLSAFGAFMALGVMTWEKYRALKVILLMGLGSLFVVSAAHIAQIVIGLG
jgi:hypothetical protein